MGHPTWPLGFAGPPAPPHVGPWGFGEGFESPCSTQSDKIWKKLPGGKSSGSLDVQLWEWPTGMVGSHPRLSRGWDRGLGEGHSSKGVMERA